MPLAVLYVNERRLTVQLRSAEQPAGKEWIAARGIGQHGGCHGRVGDLEGGAALEPDPRYWRRHCPSDRGRRIWNDRQDRSRAVEVGRRSTAAATATATAA